jgi:hypothetical protein
MYTYRHSDALDEPFTTVPGTEGTPSATKTVATRLPPANDPRVTVTHTFPYVLYNMRTLVLPNPNAVP